MESRHATFSALDICLCDIVLMVKTPKKLGEPDIISNGFPHAEISI